MATLYIVNTTHAAAEVVSSQRRSTKASQHAARVFNFYAEHMWRYYVQQLGRYGMLSRTSGTRYLFSEGHSVEFPQGRLRKRVLSWRDRSKFLLARPQRQVMLRALELNYKLVPIESRLIRNWAANSKVYSRSKTHAQRARLARDRFAARIIHDTLSGNHRGILLMGAAHDIKGELLRLHSSIRVVDLYFEPQQKLLF